MTALLREAVDRLERLPEAEQDRAAGAILRDHAGKAADAPPDAADAGPTWDELVAEARRHRENPPPDHDALAWQAWLREDRMNVTAGLIEPDPADFVDPETGEPAIIGGGAGA